MDGHDWTPILLEDPGTKLCDGYVDDKGFWVPTYRWKCRRCGSRADSHVLPQASGIRVVHRGSSTGETCENLIVAEVTES